MLESGLDNEGAPNVEGKTHHVLGQNRPEIVGSLEGSSFEKGEGDIVTVFVFHGGKSDGRVCAELLNESLEL
jgi:hypothetical protein